MLLLLFLNDLVLCGNISTHLANQLAAEIRLYGSKLHSKQPASP